MDSGVGGLSVALAVREVLPHDHIVYFADPLHFPYGEKTREELVPIVQPVVDFLVRRVGVEVLVVACGTVSSLLLPELQKKYDIPLIGIVEPACREALARVPQGSIGVLATRATVRAGTFRRVLEELQPGVEVVEEAWPEFIEAVERGVFDTPPWRAWVRERLETLYARGVRGTIMGCTHFALISFFFEDLAQGLFSIVNPALSCAREVEKIMSGARAQGTDALTVFVRGDREAFVKVVKSFHFPLEMDILSFGDVHGWVTHAWG